MKYLSILILLSISGRLFSQQIDKYRLDSLEIVHKEKDGSYLYREGWYGCNYIMIMDLTHKNLKLMNIDSTYKFNVIDGRDPYLDKDSTVIFKLVCVDADGAKCNWTMFVPKRAINGNREFMKVDYDDFTIVYKYTAIQ